MGLKRRIKKYPGCKERSGSEKKTSTIGVCIVIL